MIKSGGMEFHSGHASLWTWFGLSYASWLTLPRVLMCDMPDEWQAKMADLLREYDETFTFPNVALGTRVQVTKDGKLVKCPEWLINYRHPNRAAIDACREEPGAGALLPGVVGE